MARLEEVMAKIVSMGLEYFTGQFRWQTVEVKLQRLEMIYPKVKCVLAASNQSEIRDQNPNLDRRLWQLRDAVEEADDLHDELEYLKYKELQTQNTEETKGKKRSITSFFERPSKFRKVCEHVFNMDPNWNRLKKVVQNLVKASANVAKYSHFFESTKQKMLLELEDIRETGASPTNNFIGRCEEMESIIQWLRNSSSNEDQSHIASSNLYKNISLLSIVGHGGLGKTTLSQHAYDNEMTNKFDVKMWVCVSINFDVKEVIAGMLESNKESECNLGTLEGLQNRLKSKVMAKKFFLVLDDVWEDEKDTIKWEKVFGPLAVGSLGSKILVTTRTNSVARMIANVLSSTDHTILRLRGMKEDECLQLLNNIVFATVEKSDAQKKSILEQIVRKVLGSPLAAKVIGGVLSFDMDERHWRRFLNINIESMQQGQNIFFPILRLSYKFLPKPLQSCFSFCSIFPQDHKFCKDDLIRMWIALNFIQPSSNLRETLEDIGERYFDILIKKSFFEKFQHYGGTYYYKMHDLLHELAQFVSARECCRVMGNEELSNLETIRHLSIKTDDLEVLRKIKKYKNLRSLFLFSNIYDLKDFTDALSEIFKASSSIRLLLINAQCQIPETIGDLIHLRYLKCDNGFRIITKLPRSICTLYHMNFIIYKSWRDTGPCDFLPEDMNNLFNLRYVELPLKKLPKMHWIGELRPLQMLNRFFIKNEDGYRINELEHMNELRQLRIYQLENVKDAEEACSAKFCNKGSLMELSLQWGDNEGHRNIVHSNLDEEVFDSLQPHNNLKRLEIKSYVGTRSASWMNDVKFISNLECIKLKDCSEWQTLPPFGQLQFLKSLNLCGMPKVKNIDFVFDRNDKDCTFPSLEVLRIMFLDALECLPSFLSTWSSLKNLELSYIPLLKSLPDLPSSLEELQLRELKSLEHLPALSNISSLKRLSLKEIPLLKSLLDLPLSLERVSIKNLESLEHLSSSLSIFSSLENLELASIPLLKSLPDLPLSLKTLSIESLECLPSSLSTLSSLKDLKLSSIPLISLPDLPPSLGDLYISNLESLQSLPSSLSTIYYLHTLWIINVPLLQQLPDLPSSLLQLIIRDCHKELKKRYDKISGFDRDKLAHIPGVSIS